jgi:AhpC/TSA family
MEAIPCTSWSGCGGSATIVSAAAIGIVNVPMPRRDSIVELKPGDPAPDFSCTESDGRTDRLKDLTGRPVVIAWFPNIWTSTKRSAPASHGGDIVASLTNLTS